METMLATEELVFGETVEGLIQRTLKSRMTPALIERLRGIGVDVNHYEHSYPRATWKALLVFCAREAFPGVDTKQAFRLLGEAAFVGFTETAMGRVLTAGLKFLGPARTLAQLQRQFRVSNNYTQTQIKQVSDRVYEVWMNECNEVPEFYANLIHTGLTYAGGKSVTVEIVSTDRHSGTFRVSWAA